MHQDLRRIGRRIEYFDRLDSTNSYALGLGDDASQDGLVVIAGEQSAGRGQHGRSWTAPAGSSVLLSVLIFPPPPLRRPAVLTAWAAVSVCRLIRRVTGKHARIKWPNDLLIDERKVSGILIEQRSAGADRLAAVIGIGLNVTQPADWFAAAGLAEATSLTLHADRPLAARDMAGLLIAQLDREYQRLLQGDLATLEDCWKQHLMLDGASVLIECPAESHRGRVLNTSFAGLDVEAAGKRACLEPELIRHITICR